MKLNKKLQRHLLHISILLLVIAFAIPMTPDSYRDGTKFISSLSIQKASKTTKIELLKEGDILFQSSEYGQSKAIMLATHSKLTHCGILIKENGKWCVLEAIGPVKITPLETWAMYTYDETYKTFRLKNADSLLTQNKIAQIKSIGKSYLGKDYDIYFEWSDEKMYCSELVWKVYKLAFGIEVGKLQKLKEFDFSSEEVKAILTDRKKLNSLMEEIVISPQAIADCNLLTEIKLK